MTGDLGPLFSSLSCTELWISSMELDQAATSSLVRALQHGVERLVLHRGVRLHIQTLLEYDCRGRCGQVTCFDETWNIYKEDSKTSAARVNWDVSSNIVLSQRGNEYCNSVRIRYFDIA